MYKNKKILAIIPARAGSQRCPGKNTRALGEKPLICWTIDGALKSKYIDSIVVTSDDNKIRGITHKYDNITFIERPQELASSSAILQDVVLHALDSIKDKFDYFILLQPTSPFRTNYDVDLAIEACFSSKANSCAGFYLDSKKVNYYFFFQDNELKNAIDKEYPESFIIINGAIYICDIVWFLDNLKFIDQSTIPYIMPELRSIDIDTEEDFELATLMWKKI